MIDREFFEQTPVECARRLIGCEIRWGSCGGIIVETEAYDSQDDPACHTWFRPSARRFVDAHPPGTAYVYLNYGVHWLLNVLVKGHRTGFVLIRAIEPTIGIDLMISRRKLPIRTKLCAGPGRLTQALGISGAYHGIDLIESSVCSFEIPRDSPKVVADPRIGISQAADLPWRFTLAENPFVSRRPKAVPASSSELAAKSSLRSKKEGAGSSNPPF